MLVLVLVLVLLQVAVVVAALTILLIVHISNAYAASTIHTVLPPLSSSDWSN